MTGLLIVLAVYALVSTLANAKLYKDLQAAHQQLYTAWKDGNVIPPLEVPPVPTSLESDEFPPVLVDWLGQWEEGPAREKWKAKARVLMRSHTDPMQVINILDQPTF